MTEANDVPDREKVKRAAIEITTAVASAIKDLGRVPSGHLYGRLAGYMSLDIYHSVISLLVRTGLVVQEPGYMLVWVGGNTQPTFHAKH